MILRDIVEGFLLGLGLLVALGPKDTFVIKSSLTGKNAITLIAICALSDALLIFLGVVGLGYLITSNQIIMTATMIISILYLAYFGIKSAFSLFKTSNKTNNFSQEHENFSHTRIIKEALFHSLLTPYAWLDTVLVIGALSATKAGMAKFAFAGGAITASFLWFIFLTTGTQLAAPFFKHRRAWQIIDFIVAISMFTLSIKLMLDYPWQPK